MVHAMNLPYGEGESGRLDRSVTFRMESLPFRDRAFDAVLCSEVLEHLVRPIEAIAELLRITNKVLIITSLEALSVSRWHQLLSHHRVDVRVPHVERNFFVLEELKAIVGAPACYENLLYDPTLPASSFAPASELKETYGALCDVASLTQALCKAVTITDPRPGSLGIVMVKTRPGVAVREPTQGADAELARWLIEATARSQHSAFDLVDRMAAGTGGLPEPDRPVADVLLEQLRCPDCRRGALVRAAPGLRCTRCNTTFAAECGVPILYPTRPLGRAAHEESLDRLCGDDASRRRVVRRLAERLRRNERPPSVLRRAMWWFEAALGFASPDAKVLSLAQRK
jgi:hypothetical protein